MLIDIERSTLDLGVDGMLTLQDARGSRIICREGSIWVTQEGESKDWVLGPGEAVTIRRDGRTVVTALGRASLDLFGGKACDGRETSATFRAAA